MYREKNTGCIWTIIHSEGHGVRLRRTDDDGVVTLRDLSSEGLYFYYEYIPNGKGI